MIIRHFFEGGSFMYLIYPMWIVVLILAIRFIILYRTNKDSQKLKRINDSILFIGSFAFLFGAFGQMVGLSAALDSVQKAGGVAPSLLAGGLKVTFICPLYGLSLLILSGIIWFVFRNLLLSNE